ncbi:hypothetical protein ABZ915_24130 [Streptomyces sp. NPDC046915]|uniref:hypothetical protein n=1 Tax=Streptomyces sp. NPDC046915 TaxID=3155257 RepID=UPI0033CBD511
MNRRAVHDGQFDLAATYGPGVLAEAVQHAVRPGRLGTVLVRSWWPGTMPHGFSRRG